MATSTTVIKGATTVKVITSLKYHTLTVGATTNQTYAVTFTANSTYGGTVPSNVSGQSAQKSFSCPYGCTATVTYTANSATAQYTFTASSAVTKTMTSDQSVGAASATATTRSYTLSVGATTNQSFRVVVNNTEVASWRKSAWSGTYKYGSTYAVYYSADSATAQYTFSASSTESGTITGAVSISAKSASATTRSYTLSVGATTNQSFRVVVNNTEVASWRKSAWSGTYKYGSTYAVYYSADSATAQYTFSASSTESGTITGAKSISAKSATPLCTVTLGTHPHSNVEMSANGLTSVVNANLTNVPKNTTVSVNATPHSGYVVTDITLR